MRSVVLLLMFSVFSSLLEKNVPKLSENIENRISFSTSLFVVTGFQAGRLSHGVCTRLEARLRDDWFIHL